jgi:hypothetical protein
VEKKMPNYFSASHACKHRRKVYYFIRRESKKGVPVLSFSEFGTTLTVYGTSFKSQIFYLEPLLATHYGTYICG